MPRTDLLHVLLRRWYVVITFLLFTVALAAAAMVAVAPSYSASESVLLRQTSAPGAENPYIGLDGLQAFAASFAPSVLNDAAASKLATEGITSGYSIISDTTTPAPVLLVATKGKSAAGALDALTKVEALIKPALLQFQAGVAPKYQVISQVTHVDATAKTVRKSQTRAVLVAVVLGLVLTGLAAVGTDRLVFLRRRRRAERATQAGTQPASGNASPESGQGDGPTPRPRAVSRPTAPLSSRAVPPTRRPTRKKAGGETENPPTIATPTNGSAPDKRTAPPVERPEPDADQPGPPASAPEPPAALNGHGRLERGWPEPSSTLRDRTIHRGRRTHPSPSVPNNHD